MNRIWPVVALAILGGIYAFAEFTSRGAPSYRLRSHTSIVQGIRPTPYTDYWYEVGRGLKWKSLWHTRRMEHFKQHWISPSGVVWIETQSFTGPGGGEKIWAGDRNGVISGATFLSSGLPKSSSSSGIAETFRNGFGELLSLNKGLSNEHKLLLVRRAGSPMLALETSVTPSHPRFFFEDILRHPDLADPTIKPIEDLSQYTFLVTSKSKKPSSPDSNLIISGRSFPVNNEPASITGLEERILTGVPDQFLLTPNGYLAFLMFDADDINGRAWFEIGEGAKLFYRVDLMKLGGYRSVVEAKKSIVPKVSWNGAVGWTELPHKFPNLYTKQLDKFDFFDSNGKRFEVVVKAKNYVFDSANATVKSGLAARRTLGAFDQDKRDVVWTRSSSSPNGIFKVTVEGRDWSKKNSAWDQTVVTIMLTSTVSDRGKPIEVQLMNRQSYGNVWPKVTDSGRVFLLEIGKTNTETKRNADLAMISVCGVSPLVVGGIGLLDPGSSSFGVAKYETNADVVKGILWDQMRIVSRGKKTIHQFLGVDLPLWEVEEFWIPQANGTTIHQAIVNGNFVGTMIVDGKQKLMIPAK